MAEEYSNKNVDQTTEVSDRGLFDFMKKKDETKDQQEEVLVTGVENLHVEEPVAPVKVEEEEKKESLFEKLHRSDSSSSSSSDEEEGGDGENKEKKKKKKGLKEKIKERIDHKEETVPEPEKVTIIAPTSPPPVAPHHHEEPIIDTTSVKVEKIEEPVAEEEKRGFLGKIKDKLHKKEEAPPAVAAPPPVETSTTTPTGDQGAEKKGILGKLMEKLPGYHKEEIEKNAPPSN